MIPHVWPFDGIVGVPRSGMLAASYLSVLLSKPLFSIDNDKLHMLKFMSDFGGTRMNNFYRDNGVSNLVFIDDTTYNGTTADKLRDCFGKDIKVFSIFCTSFGVRHIDRFGEMLDPPHLLEWNFFNSSYVHGAMFDIDGVFCKNVPINVCQDEEKYIDWISNVEPIYERVPRLFRISKLVTGRLEKYRDITEAWLKKHAFYYDELIMFPTEKEEERNRNHYEVVGKFKADIFNRYYRHEYFVESEIAEAEFIRKNMKPSPIDKTIICPNEGVIL
jgi:hypothetical protein